MLEIVVPKDRTRLEKQIKALKYVLTIDKREIDREIHTQALKDLEKALDQFNQ
jgi:hypothetical protein